MSKRIIKKIVKKSWKINEIKIIKNYSYLADFISNTGVPSSISTPLNFIMLPSTPVIVIVDTPIGFGLLGEWVENKPIIGPTPWSGDVNS